MGFTLLEVMVAVAILGMVLVTLIGLKNRSMQDVQFAEHMTTATMLAKRDMTELIRSAALTEKEDEGEFPEEEFKGFTWKHSISIIPIDDVRITEIRVGVLWTESGRQEMVELVSYE